MRVLMLVLLMVASTVVHAEEPVPLAPGSELVPDRPFTMRIPPFFKLEATQETVFMVAGSTERRGVQYALVTARQIPAVGALRFLVNPDGTFAGQAINSSNMRMGFKYEPQPADVRLIARPAPVVPPPPPPPPPPQQFGVFDLASHARFQSSGTGVIYGQGFMRQQGGGVVTCAGSEVYVVPATDYFESMLFPVRALAGRDGFDPAALPLFRTGMCDAQGNFRVEGLPDGAWLVFTTVEWRAGDAPQGGGLRKAAAVQGGRQTQVFLTDVDRVRVP